ncbi:hypothetical protein H072_6710 [Dactylellina haptotyla CBS 200.50]|uniref:Endonuclease/exonuclease/phosphatase domain-containing protein n=1 Tax=Dactylellina haptotyla (strain CBS 200.50) TaxID=1284197 RepID=S8A987_DACHA|nr:hypothetical protein H072_6710 [Dactylellina haptotyla CBS 200.50]
MLFSSIISAALSALLLAPMGLVQAAPTIEGTLAVVDGDLLTLAYTTTDPYKTNWIGLYPASGGAPVNEQPVSGSLVWKYAPDAKGTIQLDVMSLAAGEYVACFLARDGYKYLASQVKVTIKGNTAPPGFGFIVPSITLRNARQGDPYEYDISGLLIGGTLVTFQKWDGDDWVDVSSKGLISGTPGKTDKDSTVIVRATSSDRATSDLKVTIPVRKAGTTLVAQMKIMTFNLWVGGTHVNDYHKKQIRFVVDTNADIIGLQEATGGHTKRLATALGWYYWQPSSGDLGVISRYPIVQDYGTVNASGGIRIALDGEAQQINFWDIHLGYTPYGPYDFCFDKMTVEKVLQREAQSGRTPQITDTLKAMAPQLAPAASNKIPVIMVGDTNAPSHLDWVEKLRAKNCGYAGVPWPTSVQPAQAGMIDSYRVAHPDPVGFPGTTWSPLYPFNQGATGKPEPQDRIDFIYHKGRLTVVDSTVLVVGSPKPSGSHQNNDWTSDHAAVLTTYRF